MNRKQCWEIKGESRIPGCRGFPELYPKTLTEKRARERELQDDEEEKSAEKVTGVKRIGGEDFSFTFTGQERF